MMNLPCPQATPTSDAFNLHMPRQALFNVSDAAAVRLVCTSGALWITVDGQAQDIVLERCEEFTTDLHQPAVVYALKPSGLFVAPHTQTSARPQRRRWPVLQRIGQSMERALARYLAHSPNQANAASAASAIWY
jgi:hypothetical protein